MTWKEHAHGLTKLCQQGKCSKESNNRKNQIILKRERWERKCDRLKKENDLINSTETIIWREENEGKAKAKTS